MKGWCSMIGMCVCMYRILDGKKWCVYDGLSRPWACIEPGCSGICCASLQPGSVEGWCPHAAPCSSTEDLYQTSALHCCLCCHQLWRKTWVCWMLSSLPEIREQDLPHGADRRTLPMPNCNPNSLLLIAGLVSAVCVLTQTAMLSLYFYTAAALSALISVASSRCSSNSSDK